MYTYCLRTVNQHGCQPLCTTEFDKERQSHSADSAQNRTVQAHTSTQPKSRRKNECPRRSKMTTITKTNARGTQCVFDPMQNLQSSEEEGSRRFSSFYGKHVPGPFSLRSLCSLLFLFYFSYSISNDICSKHIPHGHPKTITHPTNPQKNTY